MKAIAEIPYQGKRFELEIYPAGPGILGPNRRADQVYLLSNGQLVWRTFYSGNVYKMTPKLTKAFSLFSKTL